MNPTSTPVPQRGARAGNLGSAKQVFIWIVVTTSFFVAAATRLHRDGASDLGFIVAMSVAVVIAIAMVAPRRFRSIRGATPGWKDEDPYRPDSEVGEFEPRIDRPPNSAAK